ncbi:MAG: 16S rRNA (cytosine(1402)-N(4))-methyltransferase RsmH [Candidatus Pacebacteria bacterium]|jgi:16S rRNA (cytosine1402-N4)-methyltransferase|nr:16S rRNA (cytosine(1402)-N(4))-methyltransferase RsmH [Candidatus Paceibacterota bacterium]
MEHIPVLLNETLKALDPKPNENFVDCTFGRGGHSRAILERTAPKGIVIGLDWDAESLESYRANNPDDFGGRLILKNANFAHLDEAVPPELKGKIDGMLFDLGISSWHIDQSKKGFSFSKDEPLDMRFDRRNELTAAKLLISWPVKDLERIIDEYGEERQAKKIAAAIDRVRNQKKIETTAQLAAIVAKNIRGDKMPVLARLFQALRIAVNGELGYLDWGLDQAIDILKPGGRLAVITFHSLEDRIVKNRFRSWADDGRAGYINKKPIVPEAGEVEANPRARSAKLRSIIKK